jgi:hypothetical protein
MVQSEESDPTLMSGRTVSAHHSAPRQVGKVLLPQVMRCSYPTVGFEVERHEHNRVLEWG